MKRRSQGKKIKFDNRGSALVLTMIVLVNALLIVSAITLISVQERKLSGKTRSTAAAYQSADSGIEWALGEMKRSASEATPPNNLEEVFNEAFGANDGLTNDIDDVNFTLYFLDDKDPPKLMGSDGELSKLQYIRSVGSAGAGDDRTTRAVQVRYGSSATP